MQNVDIHPSVKAMRTTLFGIAISIGLVFVKYVAGYLGHSYALVADGTETAADVLSSGLLWLGLRIAMKPAGKEHPYGHGKAEPLAAILISLFLLGAAGWVGVEGLFFFWWPHLMATRRVVVVF